jgi:hypothetical protein
MLAAFTLLIGWLIVRQPRIEIRLQRLVVGRGAGGAAGNDEPA